MFHARYIACMEQTTPSRLSSAARRRQAEKFGRWLRDRMLERDYGGRGGQGKLATETGLSPSVISRILTGTTVNPDPESLRLIAGVLALPFGTVLVHAGILTLDELHAVQASPPSDRPPLTVDEAADGLKLTDPVARQVHAAGVQAARDLQRQRLNGERAG